MALTIADRVGELSSSTGTGNLLLTGAMTRFRRFDQGVGAGNTCYYLILNRDQNEWEVGLGQISGSYPTSYLVRNTIYSSSNNGSLVSFSSGTKECTTVYPATLVNTILTSAASPAEPYIVATVSSGSLLTNARALVGGSNINVAFATSTVSVATTTSPDFTSVSTSVLNATFVNATSVSATDIHAVSVSTSSLIAGTVIATSASVSALSATNIFATSVSTSALVASTVIATSASVSALSATNIFASSVSTSALYAGTVIATSASISALSATNIFAASVSTSALYAGTIVGVSASISALSAATINATSASISAINTGSLRFNGFTVVQTRPYDDREVFSLIWLLS